MSDESLKRLVSIQLNNYVKPKIEENKFKDWVLNGRDNSYFKYVNDRYIGSPTNSAILNGYKSWVYGKGLAAKDQASKPEQYARLYSILKKKDIRRVVSDFVIHNMAYLQVIRNRDGSLSSIEHIAVDKIGVEVANESNEIEAYYYSNDWKKWRVAGNEPQRIDAYGSSKNHKAIEIYCIKPYQLGMEYFALPTYQSGLQYAELEEEISNYSICHIKNGLSFGYIVNIPNSYNLSDDAKDEIENKVKEKLTGSSRAGTFMINFANGEEPITVTALEVNDAHKQWEFLSKETREKLITAHEVVSPMLFGIKDSSGFSSNADELSEAESQTIERVVMPKQNYIIDAIEEILLSDGITLDLYFKPLKEKKEVDVTEETKTELNTHICCSKDELKGVADELIALGENIDLNEWEVIDESVVETPTITEEQLSNVFNFARTPSAKPEQKSKQDTSLFKIRYRYKGSTDGEREFCNKVVSANKVYRVEDINQASNRVVNKGFGPKGADKYDIFLYKGGVNCKHFWQREIYLKKGNENISVNEAKRMILALEPSERKDARWEQNDKLVAQPAQASNNFFKLQ